MEAACASDLGPQYRAALRRFAFRWVRLVKPITALIEIIDPYAVMG